MHKIEPHYNWRDQYIASEDHLSPFFGKEYSEFEFSTRIYNYYIHPQWDDIGSPSLFAKLLYAQYQTGFAVIELLGEWNDCIQNDILFLKKNLINPLIKNNITKFIIIGENVLNFHYSDECYYEEWYEEIAEEGGWAVFINFREHVLMEMEQIQLSNYILFGGNFNNVNWRIFKPHLFCHSIEDMIMKKLAI